MYKQEIEIEIDGVKTGQYKEIDNYSTRFYAYEYAKIANITLENGLCTNHRDCGTRCCVHKEGKNSGPSYCQKIDIAKSPNTK